MKSIDPFYLKQLGWLSLRKPVSAANTHNQALEWYTGRADNHLTVHFRRHISCQYDLGLSWAQSAAVLYVTMITTLSMGWPRLFMSHLDIHGGWDSGFAQTWPLVSPCIPRWWDLVLCWMELGSSHCNLYGKQTGLCESAQTELVIEEGNAVSRWQASLCSFQTSLLIVIWLWLGCVSVLQAHWLPITSVDL